MPKAESRIGAGIRGKLVHPERWRRREVPIPAETRAIEQVEVPAGTGQGEALGHAIAHLSPRVPQVLYLVSLEKTCVGLRGGSRVIRQDRNPEYEGMNGGAARLEKIPNYPVAPETCRSGGRKKSYQAEHGGRRIEIIAKGINRGRLHLAP